MWQVTGKELWAWRHEMRQRTEDVGIDPPRTGLVFGLGQRPPDSLTLKLGNITPASGSFR